MQVGPGRGDVGVVVGQEVGVGVGGSSSRIGVLVVGILRVLGGRNLAKSFWVWGRYGVLIFDRGQRHVNCKIPLWITCHRNIIIYIWACNAQCTNKTPLYLYLPN